jgi:hypothetical protein
LRFTRAPVLTQLSYIIPALVLIYISLHLILLLDVSKIAAYSVLLMINLDLIP